MTTYRKTDDSFNDREEYLDDEPTVAEYYAAWVAAARAEGRETVEDLADAALEAA